MEQNINVVYQQPNSKVGLLGGTFDPPHMGHMHMAQCAMRHAGLDKIVFLICGNTPHKDAAGVTPPEHRLAMLKLALDGSREYMIDESELYSMEKSYTVNSMLRIKRIMPESSKLFFIIGADSLMYLDKWHDAKKLMEITSFLCIPREGYEDEQCYKKIDDLENKYCADIHYIHCPRLDAASADIRTMLAAGRETSELLDLNVQKYIQENGLYGHDLR